MHLEQMVVFLNGKGAKTALPDMAAGMVMLVIAAHVGRGQPHHKSAEIPIGPGPKKQVKMVRH
jgi:hypothetical protein